jgi:effector-binding domain-containing protein
MPGRTAGLGATAPTRRDLTTKSKKWTCLTLALGILLGVFVVGLAIAAMQGAFARVATATAERGPYRIAALDHTGPYREIGGVILKVKGLITLTDAELGPPCALYYHNPDDVPEDELRSQGGYVIPEGALVRSPARIIEVPRRRVVVAVVKAHPLVAAMKIYPALRDWMARHDARPAGPALEFYRRGEVETELPVTTAPAGMR